MAETRIADVIVPEVFNDYMAEKSVYKNAFWQSGIVAPNAIISQNLNGGGKIFTTPFWQDLTRDDSQIPIEGTDMTINNITASDMDTRRQWRENAWGATALSNVLAGSDPMSAVANYVMGYWDTTMQTILVKSIAGVVADNIANDSGDLVNDVSVDTGTAVPISDNVVIDTQQLLGDNSNDYVGICMHSKVYAQLRKDDLIDFIKPSEASPAIPLYMGMRVIVDDRVTITAGSSAPYDVYDTYIFKAGAFGYGEGSRGFVKTEIDRKALQGGGVDILINRNVFGLQPLGFSWLDASVAGTSPTDAELATAGNWNRVFEQKNAGFVTLRTNL